MSGPYREHSIDYLWRKADLGYKLWQQQRPIYDAIKALPEDVDEAVMLCSRQFGKCLAKGTDVLTPDGPVPIEQLAPGSWVYGYNSDGSIAPCRVLAVTSQGEKVVWDLGSRGRPVVSATPEHRWLARWNVGAAHERYHYRYQQEQTTVEIVDGRARKVARAFVDIPCGLVDEPHAYAIGALFGDGCGKQGRNRIAISSEDQAIPRRVGAVLGVEYVYKDDNNYTWYLSSEPRGKREGYKHSRIIECHHYERWIKGRLSREKTYDWAVVNSWNRSSLLALLAGMIDTDGSVIVAPCGTLNIRFANTNLELITLFSRVFYKLFQNHPGLCVSQRGNDRATEYTATVVNNLVCKRALRQLDEHLACPRKKWRPEFEWLYEHNSKPDRIGLKKLGERTVETFDIQVDNDTNLYLLANQGLITHNSHLGVIRAVENCLKYKDRCFLIIGPTLKQTREIVTPRLRDVIRDAPPGLVRPSKSEGKWYIGDSELVMGGFDINSGSQRGKTVQEVLVEEIVDSNPDDYLESLRSDIGPALAHSDAGKIIYLTTLPKVPDHPFITDTMAQAEMNGALYVYTIDDNKALTPSQYEACVRRAGGRDTDDFKREYLCQIIRDRNVVIIPDFNRDIHVREFDHPVRINWELYIDWGGARDLTSAQIIGFDFLRARDLVVDEMWFPSNTPTQTIVERLKDKFWETYKPKKVFADVPGQVGVDLAAMHNFPVILPHKSDWESALNNLANRFTQRKIEIHPRCKLTIQTCQSGTLNKNRTDFERTSALGHCDAAASLMYGVRHLDRSSPYSESDYIPENVFKRAEKNPYADQASLLLPVAGKGFAQRGFKRFK